VKENRVKLKSCPKGEKGIEESWARCLRLKKFASSDAKHRHCSVRQIFVKIS